MTAYCWLVALVERSFDSGAVEGCDEPQPQPQPPLGEASVNVRSGLDMLFMGLHSCKRHTPRGYLIARTVLLSLVLRANARRTCVGSGCGRLHSIRNSWALGLIGQWIALCYNLIGLGFADTVDYFTRREHR